MTVRAPERGWESLLDGDVREALEREGLPGFFEQQRWYAGKARKLESTRIVEAVQPQRLPRGDHVLAGRDALTATASPTPTSCPPAWPAAPRPNGSPARPPAGSSPGSTDRSAIGCSTTAWPIPRSARPCSTPSPRSTPMRGQSGEIRAIRTPRFSEARGPSGMPLEVIRGKAEQSNTAVMFDHRLILKAFRRVEPGINPDFEIGRFLGERTRFDRVPTVAGALEYHRPTGRADLARDPPGTRAQPGQRLGARPARAAGLLRAVARRRPAGERRSIAVPPPSNSPIASRRRRSGT